MDERILAWLKNNKGKTFKSPRENTFGMSCSRRGFMEIGKRQANFHNILRTGRSIRGIEGSMLGKGGRKVTGEARENKRELWR